MAAEGTLAAQDLETRIAPFEVSTERDRIKFCFSKAFEDSWMAKCVDGSVDQSTMPYLRNSVMDAEGSLPGSWTWRRCAGMRLLEVALIEGQARRTEGRGRSSQSSGRLSV